jgi:TonB family protein
MKILYTYLTVALILVATNYTSAQTKTVSYYNKNRIKLLSAEGAYYYEYTEEKALGGGIRTRFLKADSIKVSLFTYSSFEGEDKDDTLDGTYNLWYNNGKLSEEGNYKNNELHGTVKTWFESGQLSYEKFYVKGKLQDTLKGYYEDGALRRIEVYKEGEMVDGKVFSKEGGSLAYFPAFVMPEFPGGELKLQQYLAKSIKYPKSALKKDVSGLVVVSFVVDVDGAIRELEVVKSVHNVLDKEAVRVIKVMPNWKPGLLEGKSVPVRFKIPVRFAFEDQLTTL